MTGNGWKWMEIDGNGWNGQKLLEMAGMAKNGLDMAGISGHGQKWMEWLELAGNGWQWLEMAGNGWKLDGVGPVDNRPSTNQLHPFVQFFKDKGYGP